jgi:hypothetical protein
VADRGGRERIRGVSVLVHAVQRFSICRFLLSVRLVCRVAFEYRGKVDDAVRQWTLHHRQVAAAPRFLWG